MLWCYRLAEEEEGLSHKQSRKFKFQRTHTLCALSIHFQRVLHCSCWGFSLHMLPILSIVSRRHTCMNKKSRTGHTLAEAASLVSSCTQNCPMLDPSPHPLTQPLTLVAERVWCRLWCAIKAQKKIIWGL